MSLAWTSVARRLLRRSGAYRALVLAVAVGFAIAVLSTAMGERVVQHAHEMAALPADARLQITVSGGTGAGDSAALRAIPGVRSVSSLESPLRTTWWRPELFDGPAGRFVGWVVPADETVVDTLALDLVAGRRPVREDASAGVVPLIVSRSFVAELGRGAGVGTRLRSVERAREAEIVGIVGDFLSHGQMKTGRSTVIWPWRPDGPVRTYVVRADEADADAVLERARSTLERDGRFVRIEKSAEMLYAISQPMFAARTVLWLLEAIVLATLLLGLAAAAASRAVERRREIAVLRAIGATRRDVIAAVLAESTVATVMGLMLGCLLLLAVRGAISTAVPFLTISGAMTVAQAALFLAIAWLASVWPALRAARVPPAAASH